MAGEGSRFAKEGYVFQNKNLIILEKEEFIASHQSSRNSGVMHAGLYYDPKSPLAKTEKANINFPVLASLKIVASDVTNVNIS